MGFTGVNGQQGDCQPHIFLRPEFLDRGEEVLKNQAALVGKCNEFF